MSVSRILQGHLVHGLVRMPRRSTAPGLAMQARARHRAGVAASGSEVAVAVTTVASAVAAARCLARAIRSLQEGDAATFPEPGEASGVIAVKPGPMCQSRSVAARNPGAAGRGGVTDLPERVPGAAAIIPSASSHRAARMSAHATSCRTRRSIDWPKLRTGAIASAI